MLETCPRAEQACVKGGGGVVSLFAPNGGLRKKGGGKTVNIRVNENPNGKPCREKRKGESPLRKQRVGTPEAVWQAPGWRRGKRGQRSIDHVLQRLLGLVEKKRMRGGEFGLDILRSAGAHCRGKKGRVSELPRSGLPKKEKKGRRQHPRRKKGRPARWLARRIARSEKRKRRAPCRVRNCKWEPGDKREKN